MNLENRQTQTDYRNWICPDITAYWQLARVQSSNQIILQSIESDRRFQFSTIEGYALRYFTGQFTVEQIQNNLRQEFQEAISPNLVVELLLKLIALGIVAPLTHEENEEVGERVRSENSPTTYSPSPNTQPRLKPCVQWIAHTNDYWILRNPEDVTFLQVSPRDKTIIEQLGQLPLEAISQEFCIPPEQLRYLLQLLTATGMLVGTQPIKKVHRGKFNPLQLLFFKISLLNPDSWLAQNVRGLRWIWTPFFGFSLCFFLAFSAVFGLSQQAEILHQGQQLWAYEGASLIIPFALLTMLVVSIHELGHAFTLKHFGGIVPEFGLLFMALIPAAYTNTTDSYCLSRFKRVLVVGAGVLTQLTIAAFALWLWNMTAEGTWLHISSYLLMVASLVTVALNLNPLSKFDGYYLFVALTGINNLRSRSFGFYANLLRLQPIRETQHDAWVLATYAPFSLAYIYFVFGFLLLRLTDWSLINIPTLAITSLTLWAIYFFTPLGTENKKQKNTPSKSRNLKPKITMTSTNASNPSPESNPRPNLKVVPPGQSISHPSPAQTASTPSHRSTFPYFRLVTISALLVGLGLISQIEVPLSVKGDVIVDSTPKARQSVYMQIPGTIKRILVEPNQPVKPGQPIVELASDDLDKEIEEAQAKLTEAKLAVASAQENAEALRTTLNKAQVEEQAARQIAERQQQEVEQINQGNPPPRIQVLHSEIAGIQQDIQGLQRNLTIQNEKISKTKPLVQQGVISKFRLDDLEIEKNNLINQIQEKRNQIHPRLNQIEAIKLEMQKQLQQYQATVAQQQAATLEAMGRIKEAVAEVRNRNRYLEQLQTDLERIKAKRQYLLLTADTTGIVIRSDLDKLQHKKLQAGEPILDIVDVQQLTANVQIAQEDKPLVRPGALVTFYPRDPELPPYTAKVQNIDSVVKVDPAGKPKVTVYISLNNDNYRLKPGETGYAHIEAESMPIYQRMYREVRKLFPRGKWQPG